MAKLTGWAACVLLLLAGCSTSHFDEPRVQGTPVMTADAGQPRLWVLTRLEEVRTVGVGSGGRNSRVRWRDDTFFHFDVQAFDPATARPLWSKRLLTLGDSEATGVGPSRVIGSSGDGRVLGQEGDVVWLLLDQRPYAVRVGDGSLIADAAGLEQRNPDLAGLLPSDGRLYGFDRGLVLLAADARRLVIRGPELRAEPYVPTPPPPTPPPVLMSNGRERLVPLRIGIGEEPARLVQMDGQWLALYSEKEAADAAKDDWGDNLLFPWKVLNEGAQVRRTLWRPRIVSAQRFDDVFDRIQSLDPIPDAPSFLKGRFFVDLATDKPLAMTAPDGLLVWHSTRIDSDGRLALTRLDSRLATVWSTPLPLVENSTATPVTYWQLPGRVAVFGALQTTDDGVQTQAMHLVSVGLADGSLQAWNLATGTPAP